MILPYALAFMIGCIVLALTGFVGTVAYCKYLLRGSIIE